MHKVNQNGAIARLRLPRNRHGKGINQENACAVGNDRNETARIARDLTIDQKLFEAPASAGKLNFIARLSRADAQGFDFVYRIIFECKCAEALHRFFIFFYELARNAQRKLGNFRLAAQ